MAGFSRTIQRKVLDHVFKRTAYTAETNLYVALFTASAECSGTNYEREICNGWDAATDADPAVVKNTAVIDFGNGAADWGELTRFAIYNHATDAAAANLVTDITALTANKTVGAGDPVTFAAGALQVTLD